MKMNQNTMVCCSWSCYVDIDNKFESFVFRNFTFGGPVYILFVRIQQLNFVLKKWLTTIKMMQNGFNLIIDIKKKILKLSPPSSIKFSITWSKCCDWIKMPTMNILIRIKLVVENIKFCPWGNTLQLRSNITWTHFRVCGTCVKVFDCGRKRKWR